MDFINEKELFDKVVQPAINGLACTIMQAIAQIRSDIDGTILTIEVPTFTLRLHLDLPEEKEK